MTKEEREVIVEALEFYHRYLKNNLVLQREQRDLLQELMPGTTSKLHKTESKIEDIIYRLNTIDSWLEKNAVKEQYGYRFKE